MFGRPKYLILCCWPEVFPWDKPSSKLLLGKNSTRIQSRYEKLGMLALPLSRRISEIHSIYLISFGWLPNCTYWLVLVQFPGLLETIQAHEESLMGADTKPEDVKTQVDIMTWRGMMTKVRLWSSYRLALRLTWSLTDHDSTIWYILRLRDECYLVPGAQRLCSALLRSWLTSCVKGTM